MCVCPPQEDVMYQVATLDLESMPLQRQINQSAGHLRTLQYFIHNHGSSLAAAVSPQCISTRENGNVYHGELKGGSTTHAEGYGNFVLIIHTQLVTSTLLKMRPIQIRSPNIYFFFGGVSV